MNYANFLWIASCCPDVQYHTLNMPNLDANFSSFSVHDVSSAVWERLRGKTSCYSPTLGNTVTISMGMRDYKTKSCFSWTLYHFVVGPSARDI